MTQLAQQPSILSSFTYAQQKLLAIEAIDYFFAKEVCQAIAVDTSSTEVFAHVCIVLSSHLRAGHTCLPITDIADKCWGSADDEQGQSTQQGFTFPNKTQLLALLQPFETSQADSLLVFDQHNLYMRRYYNFETELEGLIKQRLKQQSHFAMAEVRQCIDTLFPSPLSNTPHDGNDAQNNDIDWQKLAVANAINKGFSVIAGGPGTGKTYTVTKLLAALVMLTNRDKQSETLPALDIALVAPTGKAAQRLTESINNAIVGFTDLIEPHILAAIPSKAQTMHRLLGVIPNSPNFRHHQENLLSCDFLLIDEVSMVDLPMMTRLFRALKTSTKVILLGDADQLPSVAVGNVLADIAPRPHTGYSAENYLYLAQTCQLDELHLKNTFANTKGCSSDHLSLLIKSRRFDGEGGIGKLASNVIKGDALASWQLLQNSQDNTLNPKQGAHSQLSLVDSELARWLTPLVKQYYQGIAQCKNIKQAFQLLAKFRILCVTRQGELGVDAINQWVIDYLQADQNRANNRFSIEDYRYHGMPIMISENDYQLGLFNGDIGLLWQEEPHTGDRQRGQLMAFFEQEPALITEGKAIEQTALNFKRLLPSRLPRFDSVYAMTIHKTQGSEFEHVAMILPKIHNQLLSRELLYTGITRAKKMLTIATGKQIWQQGVIKQVKRHSGLTLKDN